MDILKFMTLKILGNIDEKKVRIAFIGAGRVFKHYLFVLDKISKKEYEIVAVCDKKV